MYGIAFLFNCDRLTKLLHLPSNLKNHISYDYILLYHMICDMSINNQIICDNNSMRAKNERTQLAEIQRRLREEIINSGLTQKEIAQAIGVSPQTVSRYMHDDIFPALDTLAKLCQLLDISADYILGIKEA